MVTLAILWHIGIYSLLRVLTGFWQLIMLGAAMATFVLMLIWNHRFEQQTKRYTAMLEKKLEAERDAIDALRLTNKALLDQVTERATRAVQLEQAALKYRAEADAKVENMEYKLRNGLAMVRRIKTRDATSRQHQATGPTTLTGAQT